MAIVMSLSKSRYTVQTREQIYAVHAMKRVNEVVGKSYEKDYKRLTRRFPVLVRRVGLLHALAYLQEKGQKDEWYALFYMHLNTMLHETRVIESNQQLIDGARHQQSDYLYLTREVMYAVQWMKRLTDTMIQQS
jgi:CRISPR type III-B/RAMP module-associated protein Cmr5